MSGSALTSTLTDGDVHVTTVTIYDDVRLKCTAHGYPKPVVNWYTGEGTDSKPISGEEVVRKERFRFVVESTILIRNVSMDYNGKIYR